MIRRNNLTVLIPAAGRGLRFAQAGYTLPKPLIDVAGKPMLQRVYESLDIDANYVFLVLKDHIEQFHIDEEIKKFCANATIISVDEVTEGAACTTKLAEKVIPSYHEILIVNSDQIIDWDATEFFDTLNNKLIDCCVLTFDADHPKWSYARCDASGRILEVAEKRVISNHASVGIYYFASAFLYYKYIDKMISDNERVNNEFYICPSINYWIKDNLRCFIYDVGMMGLGVPEDLERYLRELQSTK